jgi:hypothetical protein
MMVELLPWPMHEPPRSLAWSKAKQEHMIRKSKCSYIKGQDLSWMRYHSNFPNIDFGHFFSSCCAIIETGPTRIADIIQAHKSMCDQVALLLSKLDWPHESCSWRNCHFYCNYKLIPLCRAIIAILDEKDSWNHRQDLEEIDLWSPTQSLLLVQTRDESNLSTPISFSDIEKHSLPLSQNDLEAKAEGIDVIRVTLPVAVRFIAELEERENAASPELRNDAVEMDRCLNIEFGDPALNVDTWVEKIMQEAEEKEVDNVKRTWQSVRRVKAAQRGEVVMHK